MIVRCPWCGWKPGPDSEWPCKGCGFRFNFFETHATCPSCLRYEPHTPCLRCDTPAPNEEWSRDAHCPACEARFEDVPNWSCRACGFAQDPFLGDGVCVKCRDALDLACPACGAPNAVRDWERYDPSTRPWYDTFVGRPGWACPPDNGIVPHRRMTWTVLRIACLMDRMGAQDILGRHALDPRDVPASDAASALRRICAHAGLDDCPVEELENYDAYSLARIVSTRWLRDAAGFDLETRDATEFGEVAAVYLGLGPFAVTSGSGNAAAIANRPRQGSTWFLTEEDLLLALGVVLAVQDRSAKTVSRWIWPAHAAALERSIGFLRGQPDLIPALRNRPGELIAEVRWMGAAPGA